MLILNGRTLPAGWRYTLAAIATVAAIAARLALPITGVSFMFFFPALMLIAFGLGRGPAWFGTGLAALFAGLLMLDPAYGLAAARGGWLAMSLFLLLGAGVVAVCDALAVRLVWREADVAQLAASRAALAKSEAFLRSVLGSSADCIKVLDLQANLVFMNEGGHAAMEVSDFNAIRGCPWPDFWKQQGHEEARAAVATAQKGGRARFYGKSPTMAGTPRFWDVQVTPIPGADGMPEKLLVVSRDVTLAQQNEASLRHSEERLRMQTQFLDTLIRQAPIGISITEGTAGGAVMLNERAREMLGQDVRQVALDRYDQFGAVHADGRPYAADEYPTVRALRDGVVIEREEMLYRRVDRESGDAHLFRWK